MVRTLLAIKLRILKHGFTSSRPKLILSVLMLTGTICGSTWSAVRLAAGATQGGSLRIESVMVGVTSLFGLWVFGPLLVGGVDDGLDPTRLALLPLQRRELRLGLCGAALLGPLPLGTVITSTGLVVGYGAGVTGKVLAVAAAILLLLLNLTASRALSVGLAFASRSRRGKDISVLVASLCAATIFLGVVSLGLLRNEQKQAIIRALRFLPSGQIGLSLLEADAGRYGAATARLAILAVMVMLLGRLWLRGMDRLLVDTESVRHGRRVNRVDGLGLVPGVLRRWVHRPAIVMVAKEARYLLRSPQRRSSMIISVVIGTVFALLQSLRFNSGNVASVFGAPIAMLFGVHATNNLLGTDSASLWLEESAGVRLKNQLLSRGVAATPNLVIPTVLAALVLAVMTGGWREFAILAAVAFTCWGMPLGIGTIVSVIAPFSQPDVDNPHSNRRGMTGNGGLVSLFAFVGILSLLGLAVPIPMLITPGYVTGSVLLTIGGIAGAAAYSLVVWWIGLRIALRIVGRKEVDLLARIGGRSALT
jgi:ABC-2 type transport system permease protein